MRILVTTSLYPPIALGGYEIECSAVVDHLRQRHDVLVLTSDHRRAEAGEAPGVWRELPWLTLDERGSLRAPFASARAAQVARRALAWRPDLVYAWNGANIPHAALRVLADSGTPIAFRVCEHWFGRLFVDDQFMRELLPARRTPPRAAWAAWCRLWNRVPPLRLAPAAPFVAAISWNAEAVRRIGGVPPAVVPVLERVQHPVPRHGERYASVVRAPAPEPEILFLGRVTPYKGVDVAIEALARLRADHDIAARLVVAGPEDPAHGAELRALADRRGVGELVRWLGQVDPERVAGLLARAHALIVPSVWQEPFGLVTIEGALARVPVVAADVGGISEGLRDEEHSLLFPARDAAAAAAALARVLRDRDETAARVERAHARAQEFQLAPYLDAQEAFVADALAAVRAARGSPPLESRPAATDTKGG